MHKPRLTDKVLRGLNAVRAAVEAGDLLAGDLAPAADDVSSAFAWVRAMIDYREQKKGDADA